jgi:hypothetical protein
VLPVPVVVVELEVDVLGTTQVVWQLAACELQLIMQLVVAELCASRIDLPPLSAEAPATEPPMTNAIRAIRKPHTFASSTAERGRQHNSSVRRVKRAERISPPATASDASRPANLADLIRDYYAVRM